MIDELSVFNHIEHRFRQYNQIKNAVFECRNDRCTPQLITSGNAHISNPTANKAIDNITPLKVVKIGEGMNIATISQPELWIKLYDVVRQHFEKVHNDISKFMYKRYEKKEKCDKTICDLYISPATYYKYRIEVIKYATMVACQFGLVKIYE